MKKMTDINGHRIKIGDIIDYQFGTINSCRGLICKIGRRPAIKFNDGQIRYISEFWYEPTDKYITKLIESEGEIKT